jgi:hypothetical protein
MVVLVKIGGKGLKMPQKYQNSVKTESKLIFIIGFSDRRLRN